MRAPAPPGAKELLLGGFPLGGHGPDGRPRDPGSKGPPRTGGAAPGSLKTSLSAYPPRGLIPGLPPGNTGSCRKASSRPPVGMVRRAQGPFLAPALVLKGYKPGFRTGVRFFASRFFPASPSALPRGLLGAPAGHFSPSPGFVGALILPKLRSSAGNPRNYLKKFPFCRTGFLPFMPSWPWARAKAQDAALRALPQPLDGANRPGL